MSIKLVTEISSSIGSQKNYFCNVCLTSGIERCFDFAPGIRGLRDPPDKCHLTQNETLWQKNEKASIQDPALIFVSPLSFSFGLRRLCFIKANVLCVCSFITHLF